MERRLAAILAADVAGYSRAMSENEEKTIDALLNLQRLTTQRVEQENGRVIDTAGDSILAEFASVVGAVRCALSMQAAIKGAESSCDDLPLRIGIHQGEVAIDGGRLFGDGINIASRLQAMARPGGVAISGRVHEDVAGKLSVEWRDGGRHLLKNIPVPIDVWHWHPEGIPKKSDQQVAEPAMRPSIAVLPFTNLSDPAGQDYFSDGVTEDIITSLSRFRSLSIVARHSAFAFRGQALGVDELARRLNARYIVQGSVRRTQDRVRITIELIEPGSGFQLWTEQYDRDLSDVFAVQADVARVISSTLAGRISDAGLQQALRKAPASLEAYDCLLRGIAHFRGFAPDDNQRAFDLFEQAVARDPDYALAHAHRVNAYLALNGNASAPPDVLDKAFAMTSRAIELDPLESNGHRVLGLIWLYRRDFAASEQAYRRAVDLNPSDADRIMGLGYVLVLRGKHEEGLSLMQEAVGLNPYHPSWYSLRFGVAYYSLKRYEEAAQAFRRNPTPNYWARARLCACLGQMGRAREASSQVAALLAERPNFTIDAFMEADVLLERPEDQADLRKGLEKAGLPIGASAAPAA